MVQIYCEFPRKVMQNKRLIEEKLKVKISGKGHILFLEGYAETEYLANQFVEAINMGFTTTKALSVVEEDFIFEKINIKSITRRKDLERIRARIIGTRGKTLSTLEGLTHCYISQHDNFVGILGKQEDVMNASLAVKRIISGAKQSNVYAYLEKQSAIDKQKL